MRRLPRLLLGAGLVAVPLLPGAASVPSTAPFAVAPSEARPSQGPSSGTVPVTMTVSKVTGSTSDGVTLAAANGGGGGRSHGGPPTTTTSSTTTTLPAPPAPVLKPMARGACDRQHLANPSYQAVVNCAVVKVNWADLQPEPGGPITGDNAIDQALAAVQADNTATPGLGEHLKLRVFAGVGAPEWAKHLDGDPVGLTDPQSGAAIGTVGRFWTARFGAAYDDLMAKLAARYDTVPEIRDVVVSRCTTQFAEPFLRQAGSAANRAAYFAAGYSVAADHQCLAEQLDTHARWWSHTRSSVAFSPYQVMTAEGSSTDEAFTESMMDTCRQVLGDRCVIGNNTIASPLPGPPYDALYAHLQALGGPMYFQTAIAAKIGDWRATLDWAIGEGAAMVELNADYDPGYPLDELAGYDDRLEAAAV